MIGLDTGFFVELLRKNATATTVWKNIVEGEQDAVVSCLSLFELENLFLKGSMEQSIKDVVLEAILVNCRVVWIDRREIISAASGFSHGVGLHASDALILACLLSQDVKTIYTTDQDLASYNRKGLRMINLLN